MSLDVTHHARRRAKQRFKVANLRELAREAAAHGITWEQAHGKLRRYLLKIAVRSEAYDRGVRVVAHQNRVFIFGREDVVITCYGVPHHHREVVQ